MVACLCYVHRTCQLTIKNDTSFWNTKKVNSKKNTRVHFNASTPKINNLLQPATVFLIEQVLQS